MAVGLFFIATYAYFQPQFHGHRLKQHDITQYKGMANETNHFRELTGEEPLWTNSMFGGMPTYQISVSYSGNWMNKVTNALKLWLNSPAGVFFLYLIGFYIMLMCMRVKPLVAIFGAFAFAFSTYFIIILQAGHNTKAIAIGLMAPVVGAFYMAYRYNLKWGILLSALFMGMQLASNHFQITYYLAIILVGMGVGELLRGYKLKELKSFGFATLGLIVAYGFALSINYGNISLTNEYAKHTIRGGNDITINPDGSEASSNQTSGLDRDYITQWSYGVDESFTLLSPYIKGGASGRLKESQFAEKLKTPEMRRKASAVGDNDVYWGDQPFTSGPVYVGIIVLFLAILGLVYLQGPMKWALFVVAILALILSWGKNMMGFTDFFLDYLPGYNKFRAVTIILAVVEFIIPLLGVLFLHKLIKSRDEIKANIKPFYITSGVSFGFILLLTFTGLGDGYMKSQEQDYVINYEEEVRQQILNEDPRMLMEQYGIDVTDENQLAQVINQQSEVVNNQFDTLVEVRQSIYKSSMMRSLLFLAIGIILIYVFLKYKVKPEMIVGGLLLFTIIDLVAVNQNYLSSEKQGRGYKHWVENDKFEYPLTPNQGDLEILEREKQNNPELAKLIDEVSSSNKSSRTEKVSKNEKWSKAFQTLNLNTNYRVYEPQGAFSSSRASYFHKSLGGYHGAKLRRIQNLYDFHISRNNMEVINMMNVKYILQQNKVSQNPSALGNAWFVREIETKEHPNEELLALSNGFTIKSVSNNAKLMIDDQPKEEAIIYGVEEVTLKIGDEIIPLDLKQVRQSQMSAAYVSDVNGEKSWIPQSELAKDSLNSFEQLLTVEMTHPFTPRSKAIISAGAANDLNSLTFSAEGSIVLSDYQPNKLVYNVKASGNQFAVFSEVYYPDGWKAYVDGEELPIQRVNYLLRGIELPDGEYNLEMRFEVPKFNTTNNVALAGSILLFLIIIGTFVKDFALKRD